MSRFTEFPNFSGIGGASDGGTATPAMAPAFLPQGLSEATQPSAAEAPFMAITAAMSQDPFLAAQQKAAAADNTAKADGEETPHDPAMADVQASEDEHHTLGKHELRETSLTDRWTRLAVALGAIARPAW